MRCFASITLASMLLCPLINKAQLSFSSSSYNVGNQPRCITFGDVNQDGYPDIVVANYASASISLLTNTGTGTFSNQITFSTGTNPNFVDLGDVNGDGYLDAVVANYGSNNMSVLTNTGNGFANQITYSTGSNPSSLALGDVNGDGKQDVSVVNLGDNNVSIMLNNGQGKFPSQSTYTAGNNTSYNVFTDFNNDNIADLALTNNGTNNISVLTGTGSNGALSSAKTYTVGNNPTGIAYGDYNGDGFSDLLVANASSNTVTVLTNTGIGNFVSCGNYNVGNAPQSVAFGDMNGDGLQDIVCANFSGGSISVLTNTGNGGFATQQTFTSSQPYSLAVGDINQDGVSDFAVTNRTAGTITVFISNAPTISNIKTWVGNSTDWNLASNWSPNGVPTTKFHVNIPSGLSNYPSVSSNVGVYNLTVSSSLNVSAGTVSITGTIFNYGNISFTGGSAYFCGSSWQYISGTSTPLLYNLQIKNPNGLTLLNNVNLQNALTLNAFAKFYGSNKKLTLLSSSVTGLSARIEQIPTSAYFSGTNICVQHFIPGKKVNRYISSPVQSGTAAMLQQTIVVSGNGNSSNGFDNTQYYFTIPTVRYYDETVSGATANGFKDIPTINYTFTAGAGYQVYIRGDRNNANSNSTSAIGTTSASSDANIAFTGAINQGNVSVPINATGTTANDGWNLIGNPYPCEISLDSYSFTSNGMTKAVYFMDPLTSNTSVSTTVGRFLTYTPGVGCSVSVPNCGKIASMQGFMVKTSVTGVFSFTESMKLSSGLATNFYRKANDLPVISITLNPQLSAIGLSDVAKIVLEDNASVSTDALDVPKLNNPNNINISTRSADNTDLVFNFVPNLDSLVIPLVVNSSDKVKVLQFNGLDLLSAQNISLIDNYNHTEIPVYEGSSYSYSVNTQDTASTSNKRLKLLINKARTEVLTNTVANNTQNNQVSIYPNPAAGGEIRIQSSAENNLEITKVEGNIPTYTGNVLKGTNILHLSLSAGLYLVKVGHVVNKLVVY